MRTALGHLRSLLLKTDPVHLTFFVTRRCNARCPFCFYAVERDAQGGGPELTIPEIRRVAASLRGLLWVLFSGGEPFLRGDLAGIAQAFHDAGARFLTVPTNGLLPEVIEETTGDILRRCPDSVVTVKLSLDGVGAAHDALRETPGGFERLLRSYERLAGLVRRHPRLELGVNTVFCSANQGRMDEIVDFVARLDMLRTHTITLAREGAGGGRWTDVDPDLYRRATARLEERWSRRFHAFPGSRVKAALDRVQRRVTHETLLRRGRAVRCQAGRLSFVLSERGEVWTCEGRRRHSLGNVREAGGDPVALLRSGRGRRAVEEIAETGCRCAHECNLLVNVLGDPRAYPGLAREWARVRLGRGGDRAGAPIAPAAAGMCEPRNGRPWA